MISDSKLLQYLGRLDNGGSLLFEYGIGWKFYTFVGELIDYKVVPQCEVLWLLDVGYCEQDDGSVLITPKGLEKLNSLRRRIYDHPQVT